ncbi:hypothetical protein Tco_0494016 [Tanacetum coccineum]
MTKVTPPLKPTEGSEQSYSVSSRIVPNPQDLERNIQLTRMGLPFTSPDEGICAAKITLFPEGPRRDKDLEGLKPPIDMEPQTNPVADLSGTAYLLSEDELAQESDEEEVFVAGDDMKEDIQANEEEHKEQSDKVIDAAMNSLDKNNIARGDLLNSLNRVTDTLKAIQDAVKEDHGLKSLVESLQVNALIQEKHLAEWAKSSTSMAWNLGLRLTAIENS